MDVVKNEASYETIKQAEELEWTRNKIRDSGTLVTHLESVKERFENGRQFHKSLHFKRIILKVAVLFLRAFLKKNS